MGHTVLDTSDFAKSLRDLPIWKIPLDTISRTKHFDVYDFAKGLIPFSLERFFKSELPESCSTKEIQRYCLLLSSEFLERIRQEIWFHRNDVKTLRNEPWPRIYPTTITRTIAYLLLVRLRIKQILI